MAMNRARAATLPMPQQLPEGRDAQIAWNDIEALPLYAAILIAVACLFTYVDLGSPTHVMTLKAVGIVGCLALRAAWLGLDDDGLAERGQG
jgi:hypothetical protein